MKKSLKSMKLVRSYKIYLVKWFWWTNFFAESECSRGNERKKINLNCLQCFQFLFLFLLIELKSATPSKVKRKLNMSTAVFCKPCRPTNTEVWTYWD